MSTEAIDPRYVDIDQWPTTLAVEAMLEGQMAAIAAIGSQTPRIAQAAEAAGWGRGGGWSMSARARPAGSRCRTASNFIPPIIGPRIGCSS